MFVSGIKDDGDSTIIHDIHDKETISIPADGMAFSPVAGVDGGERMHVYWAERHYGKAADSTPSEFTQVYRVSQAFSTGGGDGLSWSSPELVYEAPRVDWTRGRGLSVVAGADSSIHIVFPVQRHVPTIVHLREKTGRIRTITEFIGDLSVYADIAAASTGQMYIAYVAPDVTRREPNANSVFVRRSDNSGYSWGEAILVDYSGYNRAHDIRVVVAPDGTVHLVWLKNVTGSVIPEEVWHSYSRDNGRTWTVPTALPNSSNPRQISLAIDMFGAIHTVFSRQDKSGLTKLMYGRWTTEGWSETCALDAQFEVVSFDALLSVEGRVHLVWNRAPLGSEVESPTLYAVLDVVRDVGLRHAE